MSAEPTTTYHVREARPDELAALPAIEDAAAARFDGLGFGDAVAATLSIADLERMLREATVLVAVTGDGTLAGFAAVCRVDGCAHLEEVDVLPSHGRRGVGARLLAAVSAWAARAGLPAVTLTTYREVAWNEPFYRRHGFRALAPDEIGPGLAAILAHEVEVGLAARPRVAMRHDLA